MFTFMRQITTIFFATIFLSSCACLKKNIDNNRISLTESNLTLLDGKYVRKSLPQGKDSVIGDLFTNFFADSYSYHFRNSDMGLNLKSDVDFLELKVINKNRILVSYINENDTLASKIIKGKIKNGNFELRRRYFIVPMVFTNLYRNSKFRIGLSNDNNLIGDYKTISFGTVMVLFPFVDNNSENNMIYKRTENRIEKE